MHTYMPPALNFKLHLSIAYNSKITCHQTLQSWTAVSSAHQVIRTYSYSWLPQTICQQTYYDPHKCICMCVMYNYGMYERKWHSVKPSSCTQRVEIFITLYMSACINAVIAVICVNILTYYTVNFLVKCIFFFLFPFTVNDIYYCILRLQVLV